MLSTTKYQQSCVLRMRTQLLRGSSDPAGELGPQWGVQLFRSSEPTLSLPTVSSQHGEDLGRRLIMGSAQCASAGRNVRAWPPGRR